MGLSERMEPMFPSQVEKEANTDTADSDWGVREIILGVCLWPRVYIHMQVCACVWSTEDNCVYILQMCTCVWSPED